MLVGKGRMSGWEGDVRGEQHMTGWTKVEEEVGRLDIRKHVALHSFDGQGST